MQDIVQAAQRLSAGDENAFPALFCPLLASPIMHGVGFMAVRCQRRRHGLLLLLLSRPAAPHLQGRQDTPLSE